MFTPPCLDSWAQKCLENLVEPVPSAVHQATWIGRWYVVLSYCFYLMRKSTMEDDHILVINIPLICLLTPHDLKLKSCLLSIPHLSAFLSSATVKHQDFVNIWFVVLKKNTRWIQNLPHSLFSIFHKCFPKNLAMLLLCLPTTVFFAYLCKSAQNLILKNLIPILSKHIVTSLIEMSCGVHKPNQILWDGLTSSIYWEWLIPW